MPENCSEIFCIRASTQMRETRVKTRSVCFGRRTYKNIVSISGTFYVFFMLNFAAFTKSVETDEAMMAQSSSVKDIAHNTSFLD